MNKPVVYFIGLFVGAALFVSGRTLIVNDAPTVDPVSADPAVLKAAQDAADREKAFKAELDAREAYVVKAENKLGLAATTGDDSAAPKPNGMSKMVGALITNVMKSQMDMKMAAMKSRLNLTPDQEKAIQDVMDKQSQLAQTMAGKMMNGESPDDLKKEMQNQGPDGDALNLDKQLQTILTPDQQAEYQNMQADDKKNQAETMANMQLSTIQGSLQLTDDQKDKVFNALLQTGPGASPDAQKAALQPLLTPQQFDTYSKYLDNQTQMIQSFTAGAAGSADSSNSAPAGQ